MSWKNLNFDQIVAEFIKERKENVATGYAGGLIWLYLMKYRNIFDNNRLFGYFKLER